MIDPSTVARVTAMMVRSGLLRPGHPARTVRQLRTLARWGTSLGGSFASAAARDPDHPALIDDDGTATYAETNARSDRLALALREGPGTTAVLCRNHRALVETLLAASKSGTDLVLLNTGMGPDQLVRAVRDHRVGMVIADAEFEAFLDGAPDDVQTVTTGPGLDALIGKVPAADLSPPPRPGRTIVLSSGTTGTPKGANRHAKPGLAPLAAILSRIPFRVHERMLIEAPLFHTWGYAMLQTAISLRATIVLNRRFDPVRTLETIAAHHATSLVAVPVMLQRVLEVPADRRLGYDLCALRTVAVSGSALPGELATAFMDAFGDILHNLYGSTEASWVSIATPADLRARPDTAGTPPPGTRVAILGEDDRPVPPGVTGRIFVANELPFEGYTNHAPKETRHGLMSLGDVGHLDAEGRLFVQGRDDDMVVSGGENVFPSAVEEVILRLPQVREAAVLGVPDAEFGQRLAAYLVPAGDEKVDPEAVRDHVRAHLARFAVPRDVHVVPELPRNATGKVVHRLLREPPG